MHKKIKILISMHPKIRFQFLCIQCVSLLPLVLAASVQTMIN